MTRLITALALLLALAGAPHVVAAPSFIALAYHNVEDSEPDQTYVGVTTERLISQLSWLQVNGYKPVTVDDLLAARDGGRPLPDKAVLLTRTAPLAQAIHSSGESPRAAIRSPSLSRLT